MEEQSLDNAGPDIKSEDSNVAEAADILDSDELTKPDDKSCAVEVEQSGQGATEEDEHNMQNAPEKPEEEFGASVIDDLPVSGDFEEGGASDVEIFQNENEEEEPESQVEDDHRRSTAKLQNNLKVGSADEQKRLQELQTEHEKLSRLNYQLQTKLAEYFWLKSGGELQSVQEKIPSAVSTKEKYLDIIEDIQRQRHLQHHHVDDLQWQNKEKLEQIEREWGMLELAKREVLEQAMGMTEAQAVAERLLKAAQKCEDEFLSVRRENFKLNLKIPKLTAGLHVREEDLHGEMHRIDFEQLKIEKQSYSEKIQECMDDLRKLKKTLPHIGQILMHVKEKSRFVQVENQVKQVRFDELDALVLHEQEALTQTMQARDILRFENMRMRQDCGLLGNPTLLRDLTDTEDEHEALERQVEKLKRHSQDQADTYTSTSTCNTHAEAQ